MLYFKTAYEKYLNYSLTHLKASSYVDKIKIFNKFILPTFGDMDFSCIDKNMLKSWQDTLNDYSYKYKSKIRGYLYNFLDFCEYEYNIPNALKTVRNFKKDKYTKTTYKIYTENDYLKLMSVISDIEDKCIFNLLYLCSLRKGELCALTWDDWLKDKNCISINKTFSRVTNITGNELLPVNSIKVYKSNKVMYVLNLPKTVNGIRKIVLANSSKQLLEELYNLKRTAKDFKTSDYIFGKQGDFLRYSTLFNRFNKYRKQAHLKRIRLHDLRHSGVSLYINRYKDNVNTSALHLAYIIAERLGDSVDMVLQIYGHLFVSEQTRLADSINI